MQIIDDLDEGSAPSRLRPIRYFAHVTGQLPSTVERHIALAHSRVVIAGGERCLRVNDGFIELEAALRDASLLPDTARPDPKGSVRDLRQQRRSIREALERQRGHAPEHPRDPADTFRAANAARRRLKRER